MVIYIFACSPLPPWPPDLKQVRFDLPYVAMLALYWYKWDHIAEQRRIRAEISSCKKRRRKWYNARTAKQSRLSSELPQDPDKGYYSVEGVGYGENVQDEDADEVLQVVLQMLAAQSKAANLDSHSHKRLEAIVRKRAAAFATDQAKCKLSGLSPIEVELRDSNAQCTGHARTLGRAQSEFLKEKLETLVSIGMLKRVANPYYSCPAFVVPKPRGGHRMVIDMRDLNDIVRRSGLAFPNLEVQMNSIHSDSKFFGTFDVLSGFDMLPVHEDSRKYFAISTIFGTYEMLGAPQGFLNTPAVYSDRMIVEVLQDLFMRGANQWLDDTLLYASTFDGYLKVLDLFLSRCIEKGVRLSATKCCFITRKAEWCGRTITESKWSFLDKFYHTLRQLPKPLTGAELGQIVYLSNWIAPTFPRLSELLSPFRLIMNRIFDQAGSRKSRVLVGKDLRKYGWDSRADTQWELYRHALERTFRLNLYNEDLELCVLTDASDLFWSSVVTQVPPLELEKALRDQLHQPLFCLSGSFRDSSLNWHISQKEFFPIIFTLSRLDWLFLGHPRKFHMFIDHYNLKSILHPGMVSKAVLGRLQRWSLALQNYDFSVYQVRGEDNVFADLISRWGNPSSSQSISRVSIARAVGLANATATLFSHEEIAAAQRLADLPQAAVWDSVKQLHAVNTKIWIPDTIALSFLWRAHISMGHPAMSRMKEYIKDFHITGVTQLLKKLTQCLHCEKPTKLSRFRLGEQLHGTSPGMVLHADYLYLASSQYLLVLVDDLSQKLDCFLTDSADATTMVDALLLWRSRYGLPESVTLITDNGSHFANALLRDLTRQLKLQHRFSIKYSPWSNGSAEVQNRKLLRLFRSLSSQYQSTDYHALLPLVLNFVNNSTSRFGYSPNQIYMGIDKKPNTLFLGIARLDQMVQPADPSKVTKFLKQMQAELMRLRAQKFAVASQARARSRGTTVVTFQYQPGDWALLSRSGTPQQRSKLKLTWTGPVEIVECVSEHLYKIRSLTGHLQEVHVCRLRHYANAADFVPLPAHLTQYKFDSASFEIDSLQQLRFHNGYYEIQVFWRGFSAEDATWEPVLSLVRDVPDLVVSFLEQQQSALAQRCLTSLSSL